jgi:hypothetical protein
VKPASAAIASTLLPRNPRSTKTRPPASSSAARVRACCSVRVKRSRMGPYLLFLAGVVLTAIVRAKALAAVNRIYGVLLGREPVVRIIVPWRRSLRDARHGGREYAGSAAVSVLDMVMVLSVLAAVVAFTIWYVLVEPTPPNVGGPGPAKR